MLIPQKFLIISFLVMMMFFSFLVNCRVVLATGSTETQDSSSCASGSLCDPLGTKGDFTTAANHIIKYVLGLVGVFALIAFIWGGIEWMISGGDTKKIQKGKDMMIWAVYGMVFIFGSYAIVNMVLKALAG